MAILQPTTKPRNQLGQQDQQVTDPLDELLNKNRVQTASSFANDPTGQLTDSGGVANLLPTLNQARQSVTPINAIPIPKVQDTSGLQFNQKYSGLVQGLDASANDAAYGKAQQERAVDEGYQRDTIEAQRLQKIAQQKLLERMAGQGILKSGVTLSENTNLAGDFSRYLADLGYNSANKKNNIAAEYAGNLNKIAGQKQGLYFQQATEEEATRQEAARRSAEASAAQVNAQRQQEYQDRVAAETKAAREAEAVTQAEQARLLLEQQTRVADAAERQAAMPAVSYGGGGGYSAPQQAPAPPSNQGVSDRPTEKNIYGLPDGRYVDVNNLNWQIQNLPNEWLGWAQQLWDKDYGLPSQTRQLILSRLVNSGVMSTQAL